MKFLHLDCGRVTDIKWVKFRNGNGCKYCAGNLKLTLEHCRTEAKKRGYDVLSKKYNNSTVKMRFIHFDCGKTSWISWNVFNSGVGCIHCSGKKKLTIPACNKIIKKDGYKIVEKTYKNNKTKMDFLHLECGRITKISWSKFTNEETGCKFCNSSKLERKAMKEFSLIGFLEKRDYVREKWFSDCRDKNPLEFDFYFPKYNLLIEMQGEQHFFPVDFAGKGKIWAEKQFEKNQIRDEIKRNYCRVNNYSLLEIRYNEDVAIALKKYFYL